MAITPTSTPGPGRYGSGWYGSGRADPGLDGVLAAVEDAISALCQVQTACQLAGGEQLRQTLAQLGELALLVDAAEVAVTAEVLRQGVHRDGEWPLPLAGWVAATSRRYSSGAGAGRVARLAEAVQPATITRNAGVLTEGQDGAPLGQALLTAAAPTGCVDAAITEMRRLSPDLQDGVAPTVWSAYTDIATGGDLRQVRELRRAIYAHFGRPDLLEKEQETARAHADLSRPHTAPDGLSEYRLLLDPEATATLEAALDPLSGPQPGPDGEADPRPDRTRRAHALIEIVTRAVRAHHVPARPAGQLTLIITAADLAATTGHATTVTTLDAGRYLAATTARRIACHTETTPVCLDPHGNPLIIGRTKRLFTPTQLKALLLRDQHCTFPGCTRPAGWTDAHHLIHWIDGGHTDLHNAALLCSYHHHTVHTRRLHGWITTHADSSDPSQPPPHRPPDSSRPPDPSRPPAKDPAGRAHVHWDTTRGSYDRALTRLRASQDSQPRPPQR